MLVDKLTLLARLSDALSRATTEDAVYAASLDCLQSALGVERASILLFDRDEVMSFVAWRGISDEYRRAVNGHTPWRPETENPEPVLVADVELDPGLANYIDVFRAEGIRALGFFALTHRDRVIGKFMLYYAAPHEFTNEEVALAKTVAGQIAFGVRRIVAEEALDAERARLTAIVSNVPGMVWETEGSFPENHRVTFVSEGITDLLGYSPQDWYRHPGFWSDVILERFEGDMKTISEHAVRDSAPALHHYKVRRRDGREIWIEVRSAHQLIGGTLVSRGFTMDITQRMRAEHRNAFLAEASGVLSASLDYEKTLARVANLVVAELGDLCVIELAEHDEPTRVAFAHRGRTHAISIEESPAPVEIGIGQRVVETGEPILLNELDADTRERLARSSNSASSGDVRFESLIAVPLVVGGRTFGAITIVSSDPARRYDENDLELACELGRRAGYAIDHARLYREAQNANRAKDEFLATLSHELRTPMTSALGWATMLRLPNTSEETAKLAMQTIERSIRAQAKLLEDIFDVSRIVTGKLQLQIEPVNLASVIQASIETLQPSISAKALHLELSYDAGDEPLLGDGARLQQVIWNLLSNAVKFTQPGGEIRVDVRRPNDGELTVVVRDTGQGIPRRLLPLIFERFRQGDSSTTRMHGGLGLGLAIAKNIVELHGGTIVAESEGEGCGATFTLALPLGPREAYEGMAGTKEVASSVSLAGVHVLVVEDDEDTRLMLVRALEHHGATVAAVGSAAAALDALRSQSPHVVVSDIGMPGEDGYSLMMRIRSGEIEQCRDVPAIAITAFVQPEDRHRVLAAGFQDHMTKPIDPMAMLRTVRELALRS
jgi:PAS domain S-box-containing protein